ncbi:MAG: hypothetical protein Kow001_15720 [Acidobacteriota bacterium]
MVRRNFAFGPVLSVLLGVAGPQAVQGAQPAERKAVEVWAAPDLVKIRPSDPVQHRNLVWSASDRTVRVAGAADEHVPFQVLITVPPRPNRYSPITGGFEVEAGSLSGPEGTIPATAVQLYLQHPILVYAKSSPVGGTGFWTDPLIPLSGPFDMAAPFREALETRGIWVDIHVPSGTAPGLYAGTVVVRQQGEPVGEVKVELEVYDFQLPGDRHLITYMGILGRWLEQMHGVPADTPEGRRLLLRYHEFLQERRMEPWFNGLLEPEVELRPDGEVEVAFDLELYRLHLDTWRHRRVVLEAAPGALVRRIQAEPFSDEFRRILGSYLRQTVDFFQRHGWKDRLVLNSPIDEPNTAEAYQETRRWAALVREYAPGVPFLVTESPIPDRPEWGELTGHAQNFSIHGNQLNQPELRRLIPKLRQQGSELTWYISCDQVYPQPNYFIDAPAMDPVMIPWITRRYGLDGILYWALNFWPQTPDPWLDPVTYLSGFLCSEGGVLNGEGSLLYPGNRVSRHSDQADVDGPVSSIRLELLREGIEDYEYLWLLASLGDAALAEETVRELVSGVGAFSRNPEELYAARRTMATRIVELRRRSTSARSQDNRHSPAAGVLGCRGCEGGLSTGDGRAGRDLPAGGVTGAPAAGADGLGHR